MELFFSQLSFLRGKDFRKDIKVLGRLGSGNSQVYEVKYKDQETNFAMKEVIIKDDKMSIDNEIELMQKLTSLNTRFVIQLVEYMVCEDTSNGEYGQKTQIAYILMEKGKICLMKYVEQLETYPTVDEFTQMFQVLIDGFVKLQQLQIAHRDVKPENILVMHPFNLKVCDVGTSMQFNDDITHSVVGTISFLSPELFYSQSQSTHCDPFKSDVFSLGLCFIYMITSQKWIQNKRQRVDESVYAEVLQDWIILAERICGNDKLISAILHSMLTINPKNRPDFIGLQRLFNHQQEMKLLFKQKNSMSPTINILIPTHQITDSPMHQQSESASGFFRETKPHPGKIRQFSQSNLNHTPKNKRAESRSASRDNSKPIDPPKSDQRPVSNTSSKFKNTIIINRKEPTKSQFKGRQHLEANHNIGSNRTLKRVSSKKSLDMPPLSPQQRQFQETQPPPLAFSRVLEMTNNKVVYQLDQEFLLNEDQFVSCDFTQAKLVPTAPYISVSNKLNSQNFNKLCQLPLCCQYLELKINAKTSGFTIGKQNHIQTLIVEVEEDHSHWADFLHRCEFPNLQILEFTIRSNQAYIDNIKWLLDKYTTVDQLRISIYNTISEQDHKSLISKISNMGYRKLTLRFPSNKLYLQKPQNQWLFNPKLQLLHLDYGKTGISTAIGSLTSSLQPLTLQHLYLDISSCFSKHVEICLLIQYICKQPLKELTLILDNMLQFHEQIMIQLCKEIPKIVTLNQLHLSLLGVNATQQHITQLINTLSKIQVSKSTHISLRVDRTISKEWLIKLKDETQSLKLLKLQFLTTQTTMVVYFIKTPQLIEPGMSKCNQGMPIKSSKMHICIPCSQKHQHFLKRPVYLCTQCLQTCHKTDEVKIQKKKIQYTHSFIDSADDVNQCDCAALGMCKLETTKKCHPNNNQIILNSMQYYCIQCDQVMCNGCRLECHQHHEISEMYISKQFTCGCDRGRNDIFND